MHDYYKLLEINKDASSVDIKKAYRRLALKYHPDKNKGSKESEEQFKLVSEAYAVLSDPAKKQSYDRRGAMPNINDILRGFNFTDNGRFSRQRRPKDIKYLIEVPFYKFIFGGTVSFTFSFNDICTLCEGTGALESSVCNNCNGTGMKVINTVSNGARFTSSATCPQCMGKGRIAVKACHSCSSTGLALVKDRKVEFTLPKNSENGIIVNLPGKGGSSPDGASKGTLYIKCNMQLPNVDLLSTEEADILKGLLIKSSTKI